MQSATGSASFRLAVMEAVEQAGAADGEYLAAAHLLAAKQRTRRLNTLPTGQIGRGGRPVGVVLRVAPIDGPRIAVRIERMAEARHRPAPTRWAAPLHAPRTPHERGGRPPGL